MLVDRKNEIRRGIISPGIDVEHEVRPDIGIDPFLARLGRERHFALRLALALTGPRWTEQRS